MGKICKTCLEPNKYSMQKYCSTECTPKDHFSKRKFEIRIKKTPLKQVGKKRGERLANGGSEALVFQQIHEIDNKCWITGWTIPELTTFSMPHLLNKKDHPALRLIQNNIGRAYGMQQHDEVDKLIVKIKKDLEDLKKLKLLILSGTRAQVKEFVLSFREK